MDGELRTLPRRARVLLLRPVHTSAGSETVCKNLHSRLLSAVKQVSRQSAGTGRWQSGLWSMPSTKTSATAQYGASRAWGHPMAVIWLLQRVHAVEPR